MDNRDRHGRWKRINLIVEGLQKQIEDLQKEVETLKKNRTRGVYIDNTMTPNRNIY